MSQSRMGTHGKRFVILGGIGMLVLAGFVAACDCLPPPPPKEAMAKSAAVFLARVVKVVDDPAGAERTVTLDVERWWKGDKAKMITVSTAKSGAACGYGFQVGSRYLVYAHAEGKKKDLHVSLCSRTRTAEQAEMSGDFKQLGEGKPAQAKK